MQNAAAGNVALQERRFRQGIRAGEIPPDFPVAERASQVTDQRVSARKRESAYRIATAVSDLREILAKVLFIQT